MPPAIPDRYGALARALHWGLAALIVLQIATGSVLEDLPRKSALRAFAFDAHESVGLVVLLLVAWRLVWRLTHPVRAAAGPRWQRLAAHATHALLYALMFALPLVGYAMVDLKGYDVAFFGLAGPDLLPTDEPLAKRLAGLHEALAWALAALVALHVGAAAWHRSVLRDGVFERMLPPRAA